MKSTEVDRIVAAIRSVPEDLVEVAARSIFDLANKGGSQMASTLAALAACTKHPVLLEAAARAAQPAVAKVAGMQTWETDIEAAIARENAKEDAAPLVAELRASLHASVDRQCDRLLAMRRVICCPKCPKVSHAWDADFCSNCGAKLPHVPENRS